MHLPLHSLEFLFYSLLSINVLSFLRSQNFLIISAKMRASLSKTGMIQLVLFLFRIKEAIPVVTPIDWRILFTQCCLVIFNSRCISSLILFLFFVRPIFVELVSLVIHRIPSGIALQFRTLHGKYCKTAKKFRTLSRNFLNILTCVARVHSPHQNN